MSASAAPAFDPKHDALRQLGGGDGYEWRQWWRATFGWKYPGLRPC